MSAFERRVRAGLQRLEEAVPEPRPPASRRPSPRRRRQVILLLAATAALLAVSSLVATAERTPLTPAQSAKDSTDEERVRDDIGQHMGNACLSRPEAAAVIRERLNALGLADWTIRVDYSTREAPCVGSAAIGDTHEVLLTPSMGGQVADALDGMSAQLMNECLRKEDALNLLKSTLTGLGVSNPKVETGGVRGVPLEYGDAYLQHIADGCYVYAGAQFDDVGRYTWYLAGP